jgi:hypothetical protein
MGNHDDVVTRREIGHGEFALPPAVDKRSLLTQRCFSWAVECHPTIHKEPACQPAFYFPARPGSVRQQFTCHRILERVLIYIIEVSAILQADRFQSRHGTRLAVQLGRIDEDVINMRLVSGAVLCVKPKTFCEVCHGDPFLGSEFLLFGPVLPDYDGQSGSPIRSGCFLSRSALDRASVSSRALAPVREELARVLALDLVSVVLGLAQGRDSAQRLVRRQPAPHRVVSFLRSRLVLPATIP